MGVRGGQVEGSPLPIRPRPFRGHGQCAHSANPTHASGMPHQCNYPAPPLLLPSSLVRGLAGEFPICGGRLGLWAVFRAWGAATPILASLNSMLLPPCVPIAIIRSSPPCSSPSCLSNPHPHLSGLSQGARLPRGQKTGTLRGFGFVTFQSPAEARRALTLPAPCIDGQTLTVKLPAGSGT